MTPEEAMILTTELHRVLQRGGVCRMVAPDLELATTQYLESLEQACGHPAESNTRHYEWATAALIDQMVRKKSGGVMGEKLSQNDVDWNQIKKTNGDVFDNIRTRIESGNI